MLRFVKHRPAPATVIASIALFVSLGGLGVAATGGNFILGHTNTAGLPSILQGAAAKGPQLQVSDSAAGQNAIVANSTGGYGLFAQTSKGPAIGMSTKGTAAPMTVNGAPFPSVTGLYHDDFVTIPQESTGTTVASLPLPVGTYAIFAKLEAQSPGNNVSEPDCTLAAGLDSDSARTFVEGSTWDTLNLMVFHTFAASGNAVLSCQNTFGGVSYPVERIKILAIRVSGGTNTAG